MTGAGSTADTRSNFTTWACSTAGSAADGNSSYTVWAWRTVAGFTADTRSSFITRAWRTGARSAADVNSNYTIWTRSITAAAGPAGVVHITYTFWAWSTAAGTTTDASDYHRSRTLSRSVLNAFQLAMQRRRTWFVSVLEGLCPTCTPAAMRSSHQRALSLLDYQSLTMWKSLQVMSRTKIQFKKRVPWSYLS